MSLDTQIISLLFSFGYGIFVSYLFNFNYNFIYLSSLLYRIVINILFTTDLALVYFLLIKVINYGVIHIYFVFAFLLGFILFVNRYKFLRKLIKVKKYVKVKRIVKK